MREHDAGVWTVNTSTEVGLSQARCSCGWAGQIFHNWLDAQDEADIHNKTQMVLSPAQVAFVRSWREQHPDDISGASWTCPLCNRVLQATENDPAYEHFLRSMVERHQRWHGAAWEQYAALENDA